MSFAYSESPFAVPQYKADAHRGAWHTLAQPGSWWTGSERIAIAQASRAALDCPLCSQRKAALSPFGIDGEHLGSGQQPGKLLDSRVIDAVHRVTSDSARLTEDWVQGLIDADFSFGHYVEMVSVIVSLISVDSFHRALGLELEPLPAALGGQPDHYLPPGAAIDVAWVPMIYPDNLSAAEADIYFGAPQMGHVIRALSLVPEAVRWLHNLSAAHYLPTNQVGELSSMGHLSLSRVQTELVAARTSIHNDCFY